MADIILQAIDSVSVDVVQTGWAFNPLRFQASDSVIVRDVLTRLAFFPDEIMELGDDTLFDSPYNEIETFIMRR